MNHPTLSNYKEVLHTDYATFFLNDLKDTLLVKYKESTLVDVDIAKNALSIIKPFKDAGSVFAIIDFSAKFIEVTKPAQIHFKENVNPTNTKAVAVNVEGAAIKIAANFYARFNKPRVHTRVFNSIEVAEEWIKELR